MTALTIRGQYPEEWRELAQEVKEAAGWRCVRCGHLDDPMLCLQLDIPRGELPCDPDCEHPSDGKRRVLTVHHMDGDKGNGRWWNLLPLCQACHLLIQAKLQPERMYLWPHRPWFRVYAAGYYAHVVLQEELTREEAESRLEELLRAGQPHLAEVIVD